MKIVSARIQNFKGVRDATLKLQQPGEEEPDSLHAVLGDNGSGKTTILQAIALTLGLATRRVSALNRFPWYGFVPQRLSTMGKTEVDIEVALDAEEIAATKHLFNVWRQRLSRREARRQAEPGESKRLRVSLKNGWVTTSSENGGYAGAQLLGRHYLRELSGRGFDPREHLGKVGDVFWYDQYRNLGRALETPGAGHQEGTAPDTPPGVTAYGVAAGPPIGAEVTPRESWILGVDQLRRFLQDWWTYHVSPQRLQGPDLFPELENLFGKVFPGTQFRGPQPMDATGAESAPRFFFLLERAGRVFDIAEMSSGEQAIFPLICDIVRLNVRKSVVLIDELEMHLHPPEQQALLAALPKMAPDCQFIITTHSPFVEGSIPKEQETRLREGRLCL
jgi:hypothetical protein